MMGCWLDILFYIAIGLTIIAFTLVCVDQRRALKRLKKRILYGLQIESWSENRKKS